MCFSPILHLANWKDCSWPVPRDTTLYLSLLMSVRPLPLLPSQLDVKHLKPSLLSDEHSNHTWSASVSLNHVSVRAHRSILFSTKYWCNINFLFLMDWMLAKHIHWEQWLGVIFCHPVLMMMRLSLSEPFGCIMSRCDFILTPPIQPLLLTFSFLMLYGVR